jgi:hypothetical protein
VLTWDVVKSEFEWEGSWRDIYVLDTGYGDWQRALDAIRASNLSFTFRVRDDVRNVPTSIHDIFALGSTTALLLSVFVRGVQLNCHFFCESEIEFDLDPREMRSQCELDAVLEFMKTLAGATGKTTVMTPENVSDAPFIRVEPSGDVEYMSTAL